VESILASKMGRLGHGTAGSWKKPNRSSSGENAKTQAQAMMLKSVTEAFDPLIASKEKITSRLVLTRLFMVLSRAQADPLTQVYLPQEAMTTLKLLKELTT